MNEHGTGTKPVMTQAAVVSRQHWQHAFGLMLIETCVDGSVWIDGKPVPDTLPAILHAQDAAVAAVTAPASLGCASLSDASPSALTPS